MVADNLARAVIVAAIPLCAAFGVLSMPLLYTLAALAGALTPATQVGTRLLIPRLVADEELEAANAAFGLTEHVSTIAAPAIAGLAIAAGGAMGTLWIDAASFVVMAVALAAMPDLPRGLPPDGEKSPSASSPLALLWRYPAVLVVTLLSVVFFFAYGPTEAAMPLFVKQALRGDARGLGLIWSSVGIGALLGNLAIPLLLKNGRTGITLAIVAVIWGICEWMLSRTSSVPMATLCFFAGGVAWGPYVPLKTTLTQRLIPAANLGSVLGVQTALLSPTAPLGTALGGVLLGILSPGAVIGLAGLACVAGGAVALCFPALRRAGTPTAGSASLFVPPPATP
jgi:hypothetical protein